MRSAQQVVLVSGLAVKGKRSSETPYRLLLFRSFASMGRKMASGMKLWQRIMKNSCRPRGQRWAAAGNEVAGTTHDLSSEH